MWHFYGPPERRHYMIYIYIHTYKYTHTKRYLGFCGVLLNTGRIFQLCLLFLLLSITASVYQIFLLLLLPTTYKINMYLMVLDLLGNFWMNWKMSLFSPHSAHRNCPLHSIKVSFWIPGDMKETEESYGNSILSSKNKTIWS